MWGQITGHQKESSLFGKPLVATFNDDSLFGLMDPLIEIIG